MTTDRGSDNTSSDFPTCKHPLCAHPECDGTHVVVFVHGIRTEIDLDIPLNLLHAARDKGEWVLANEGGVRVKARTKVYS